MTDAEKLKMVKAMTGETDEDTLSTYLSIAGNKVCRKAYPFDEGQTAHSENGISRSYEDGDVPPTLLRDIVPFAAVMGG